MFVGNWDAEFFIERRLARSPKKQTYARAYLAFLRGQGEWPDPRGIIGASYARRRIQHFAGIGEPTHAFTPGRRTFGSLEERFWRHVDKSPGLGVGDCWLWRGPSKGNGYGVIGSGGVAGRNVHVHRLSFKLAHGRFPDSGMCACHRCDVRLCVNPSHLFEGTPLENVHDMIRKGRARRGAVKRGEGHPSSKLTEAQVTEIRTSTLPARETAQVHGVSPSLIRAVRQRLIWRHVA